ncbi:MAG: EF2563 family selenium-dependent molybdenum hydroxylase system protein [Treponema sp.]|jgi:xanthine dehydrogenase accessory factor|nr:EF2563 family selenium-dependent molybdenum hydroxylase system protein [Treponema sp.]
MNSDAVLVVIKGAGDIASGIALRLHHGGFAVAMTETAAPTAVRRRVCFSQAVYEGRTQVEDITAVLVRDDAEMLRAFAENRIAVFVDPSVSIIRRSSPAVVVDAIMAKKNTGTALNDAPVVIGAGPGFTAGIDCHGVVETMRGHTLGRLILRGGALPDTGIPGSIGGYTSERLLRAGADGVFEAMVEIGDTIRKGESAAVVRPAAGGPGGIPVRAEITGIVRGLLPSEIPVVRGMKAGDIDPRCEREHCFTVSDKALAVAGGVLEGILRFSLL